MVEFILIKKFPMDFPGFSLFLFLVMVKNYKTFKYSPIALSVTSK